MYWGHYGSFKILISNVHNFRNSESSPKHSDMGLVVRKSVFRVYDVIKLKSSFSATGIENKSEYDQEIPQSQTADQPTAPWGRATGHLQQQDI